jgi:uncharacterized membrane protein YeiH
LGLSLNNVMHILDLVGTAVFAITGALSAGRKRMDIFGVVVLGCVTALGGGTLRDVILGAYPIFWISNTEYFGIAAIAAFGTFLSARYWKLPSKILIYADAVGLAVFTVIGFQKGLQATQDYSLGIVMGVTTGVVGGIIRDLLSGEIPLILRREIYASASLGGALLLAILSYWGLPRLFIFLVAALVILAFRLAALHWNLALPLLWLKEDQESTNDKDQRP